MFTGLVTDIGRVVESADRGGLHRIRIACRYDPATIALGASIACGGPCLTVVGVGQAERGAWFDVDVAAETLERTTARTWREGTRLNLERSLRIGDELGGHLVTGHIDGVATILAREEVTGAGSGRSTRFTLRVPSRVAGFVAEKGSVALDGTSLTVNRVEDDTFSVLLIPHSLDVTTWGERQAGDGVNLEVDLMARYAARLAQAGPAARGD
ncbi:riboflavin synthase [Enterovirga sp.]|jgi:riboflavin synthase|uniref:riboflavin synthase n=1 Tax=Enterovirga sp. TaxID=2026350 RepID=UPI002626568C|nr:riboflavin synthase [Enterovirga sp.]MDB5592402.1 riboflavin synthase subunit alpha [Enterovirga sp.]